MTHPPIALVIRALAEDGRAGAIGLAEHAVDMHLGAAPSAADRDLALDILTRDLAGLRGLAPHLCAFIARVEAHVERVRRAPLPLAA